MATYNFDQNNNQKEPNKNEKPKNKRKWFHVNVGVSYPQYKNPVKGIVVFSLFFAIATTFMILFARVFNNVDGYTPTTAEITKIDRVGDSHFVLVKYKEINYEENELNTYVTGMHEGQIIEIYYKNDNPWIIKYVSTATKTIPYVVTGVFMGVTAPLIGYNIYRLVKNKKKPA